MMRMLPVRTVRLVRWVGVVKPGGAVRWVGLMRLMRAMRLMGMMKWVRVARLIRAAGVKGLLGVVRVMLARIPLQALGRLRLPVLLGAAAG